MSKRQKGKSRKRSKSWHRTRKQGRVFDRATKSWPQIEGVEHDGAPVRVHRHA